MHIYLLFKSIISNNLELNVWLMCVEGPICVVVIALIVMLNLCFTVTLARPKVSSFYEQIWQLKIREE